MNCRDVMQSLMAEGRESRQGKDIQEHLKTCHTCKELVHTLHPTITPEERPTVVLGRIQQGLATDLCAVRPLASPGYYFAACAAIFVVLVVLAVRCLGAFAITVMTPVQTATVLGALAVSTASLINSVVREMAPGDPKRIPREWVPMGVAVVLALVTSLLFRFGNDVRFWPHAWSCIRLGIQIGLGAAVPFWFLVRRGALLRPAATGAGTGLLAGFVATGALEIHCPNLDAQHILLAHLGTAAVCSIGGLVVGVVVNIAGNRSARLTKVQIPSGMNDFGEKQK